MNHVEDRLRDAFAAAAETVRPETVGVLRQASRPAGRRRLAPLAAAAAVAVIIVAASVITPLALAGGHRGSSGAGSSAVPSPSPSAPAFDDPGAIEVPHVVGASIAQAEALLSGAGLQVKVQAQIPAGTVIEQIPTGTVMEQTPVGGTRVASGATVTVVVAVGSGPSATITLAPPRLVSIAFLAVTIAVDPSWQAQGVPEPSAFFGVDGFAEVFPFVDSHGLRAACTRIASQRAYGSHPQITYRSIDGQPGCLIVPSADAPVWFRLYGGPALRDSSILVEYRRALSSGDNILQISADPAHLQQIADSVQLHH